MTTSCARSGLVLRRLRDKLFMTGVPVLALALWAASGTAVLGSPQVAISGVDRLQPGWIRIYLTATQEPAGAQYRLKPDCAAPTKPESITATTHRGKNLAIDVRANLGWLGSNSLPAPCHMTRLEVEMLQASNVVARATANVDIRTDLPLSHLTPANTALSFSRTSIPIAPSPYAAYPPLTVAIQSPTGAVAFAELEELPNRGTLGLRGLATFQGNNLVFELGGGGEMPSGWGLDVNRLGIWRAPQSPEEISNPGHDAFPYAFTEQPPMLLRDSSLKIYPAPPLFTEADYLTHVLHNRGIRRCLTATGCMDIVYDAAAHRIDAVNGARLALVSPAPIPGFQSAAGQIAGQFGFVRVRAREGLEAGLSDRALELARRIARANARVTQAAERMPRTMNASSAPVSARITRDHGRIPLSPQELSIARSFAFDERRVREVIQPTASCVVNTARTGVTATPSRCEGMGNVRFACPTAADPIDLDAIGASTPRSAIVNGRLPPYYAGRDNFQGTCGSHAWTQYVEMLLSRYGNDLGVRRIAYVKGDPIVIPEPQVALSVTAGLVQLYTWDGTQGGDPPDQWPGSNAKAAYPAFPEAYWPAREGNFSEWTAAVAGTEPLCAQKGFWYSGFCLGQGRPGPGVYRSHSLQVQNLDRNPLLDGAWSLANSYFNFVSGKISLSDRDAAIQDIIKTIRGGLPVNLSYKSSPQAQTPDGAGGILTFRGDATWFLPPELGGCSTAELDAIYNPGIGHNVNIVGYQIAGNPARPDPFRSYFIIQNNWGKGAGYRSFFFMNFAAFKYLATDLTTWRLDRACWSVACAYRPVRVVDRLLLKPLLFPPDPSGPIQRDYERVLAEALPQLGGIARRSDYKPPASLQWGGPAER